MKIQLDAEDINVYKITSYGDAHFQVKEKIIDSNLIISKHRLIENWLAEGYPHLTSQHLDPIIAWQPEIIVLGTGKTLHFPTQALTAYVISKNIGFEVMDTGAACRSYNLLVSEGREVVACLFLP